MIGVQNQYQSMITLFAELYKYPDETFTVDVMSGIVEDEMDKGFLSCSLTDSTKIDLQLLIKNDNTLQKQYMRAFSGLNKPFSPPVESLYKPWSDDPNAPTKLVNKKGYYMGDSALHMKHLLDHNGFEIPEEFKLMPDHLVIELEFYAFLITEDQHAAMTFYEEHLDWISDFEKELNKIKDVPFYQVVTKRLRNLLSIKPLELLNREE